MYDKQALMALVRERRWNSATLPSPPARRLPTIWIAGRSRWIRGANLIAEGILELLGDDLPDAIGGMAIGADPITAAVITVAGRQGKSLRGFIVRKEAKTHGKGRDVEGPVSSGDTAVIVEDVVTTGGSSLAAIEKAQAAGLKILGVIAIIDRLEGGAEAFAAAGYPLRTLLTIRDFGIEPPKA